MSINNELYRSLSSGSAFSGLIPASNCNSKFVGDGDTTLSVQQMAIVVQDYSDQMRHVAQKLKRNTLPESAAAVHSFLYNHFQYKADMADQILRSPACSWAQRFEGIDCKSYTILASSILLEMGYSNIIRRIKQPGYMSEEFTHVYCILPIDQQNNSLSQGYFVIDGTIPTSQEPSFIDKHDTVMNHYALNAPVPHYQHNSNFNTANVNGLAGLNSGEVFNGSIAGGDIFGNTAPTAPNGGFDMGGVLSTVSTTVANNPDIWAQVKNFASSLFGCSDGADTAFNGANLKRNVDKMNAWYSDACNRINIAIKNNDTAGLQLAVNTFIMFPFWGWVATDNTYRSNNWNACTDRSFGSQKQLMEKFRDSFSKSLHVYLNQFFDKVPNPSSKMSFDTNDILRNGRPDIEWVHGRYGKNVYSLHVDQYESGKLGLTSEDRQSFGYSFMLKPSATQVPPFNVTAYAFENSANPSSITASQLIPALLNLGGNYLLNTTQNPNNPYPNNSTVTIDPSNSNSVVGGYTDPYKPNPNQKNAGFGLVGGFLLVAAALAVGNIMKKQPKNQ